MNTDDNISMSDRREKAGQQIEASLFGHIRLLKAWVSLMIMTTTCSRGGDDLVAEKINKPQIERTGGVN